MIKVFMLFLESVHLICSGTLSSISVTGRIKGVLQGQHERAVVCRIELMYGNILVQQRGITITLIKDVVGLQSYTELIIEERFIEFGIEIRR